MKKWYSMILMELACLIMVLFVSGCALPGKTGKSTARTMPVTKRGTAGAAVKYPFPQSIDYPGCIKPGFQVDQELINRQVKELYVDWVATYVKSALKTPGGYYLDYDYDPTGGNGKTTSEAHGYGMIIFAMMAGSDLTGIPGADMLEDPKTYFDGMYAMYDAHRSLVNKHLMSWVIDYTEDPELDGDSTTAGDMDIAYALVMAHDQWGSNGMIDYLNEARRIITHGIKESEMCPFNYRVMLGDWSDWSSSLHEYGTRPSDWMAGHFRVFYRVTYDDFWLKAIDEVYSMTDHLQTSYAPNSGLLPDFVVGMPPKPAYHGWWPGDPSGWLEGPHDGDYAYNACRFPWRIAVDYALYGEERAKRALDRISSWLIPSHSDVTGDPPVLQYLPGSIVCGYYLDGTKIRWDSDPPYWHGMSFTAPFTLACMVNSAHQDAVDRGWWEMVTTPEACSEDSVNLLCALLLSGNWWEPAAGIIPPPTPRPRHIGENIEDYEDYVRPDIRPPLGLAPDNVPMFVTVGWNDNDAPEGLAFVRELTAGKRNSPGNGLLATYDGLPVSNTFFHRSMYADPAFGVGTQFWKPFYDAGIHETASHSHTGEGMSGTTPALVWENEIRYAQRDLSALLGPVKLYGWRTPNLLYSPQLFDVLKQENYWYDCSIEEGFKWRQDGTNYYWPYTLDEGSPGHTVLYEWGEKLFDLGEYPGLWELPVYCFVVPPADICPDYGISYDLRAKIREVMPTFDEDEGKVTGTDMTLWVDCNLTGPEAEAVLKYTLDLRLLGNRAPLMISAHSGIYSQEWQDDILEDKPDLVTATRERREAIEGFYIYALSKPDVRMVSYKQVLRWLRYPIGLDGNDPTSPTPTPTALITPTPTQLPLVNIALGKPCVASSEYDTGFTAAQAVDDDVKSIWASALNEKASYLYVDLGEVTPIRGINVQWFDKYYATKYKIYLSRDGQTWNDILTMTNNAPGDDKLIAAGTVKTRYVGLYFIEKNDAAYAIKEFQVLAPQ